MAYNKTNWLDRSVQYPQRFTRTTDGTYDTLVPAPGTVTQSGTPLTAAALNNLETQYDQAMYDIKYILFAGMTGMNGWNNYGSPYNLLQYGKDSMGFVTCYADWYKAELLILKLRYCQQDIDRLTHILSASCNS
jgi:hypothetical protein